MAAFVLLRRALTRHLRVQVFDGCDALLLTVETSVGLYPVETIQTLSHILEVNDPLFKEFGDDLLIPQWERVFGKGTAAFAQVSQKSNKLGLGQMQTAGIGAGNEDWMSGLWMEALGAGAEEDNAWSTGGVPADNRVTSRELLFGLSDAAVFLARHLCARVIVVFSNCGAAARHVAAHRPDQPVLVLTSDLKTEVHLRVVWGTNTRTLRSSFANVSVHDMPEVACRACIETSLAEPGDMIVILAVGVEAGETERPTLAVQRIPRRIPLG